MLTWFRGWCDRNEKPVVVISILILVPIAIISFLNVPYFIVGIIATFFLGFIIGAFTHSMLTPQEPLSKPQPKAESVPIPTPAPTPISQHKPKPSLPRVYHGKFLFEGFEWPFEVELPEDKKTDLKVSLIKTPHCPNCNLEALVQPGYDENTLEEYTFIQCPNADMRDSECRNNLMWNHDRGDLEDRVRIYIEGAIRKGEIDPYATPDEKPTHWTPKQPTPNIVRHPDEKSNQWKPSPLTPNIVRVKEMAKTEEKKVEPPPPRKRSQAGRAGKE